MPDPTPIQPDTVTPTPGIVPVAPGKQKKDPRSHAFLLNPDNSLHIGAENSPRIQDRRADPCCPPGEPQCRIDPERHSLVCDDALGSPFALLVTYSGSIPCVNCLPVGASMSWNWEHLGRSPDGVYVLDIPADTLGLDGWMTSAPVTGFEEVLRTYSGSTICTGTFTEQRFTDARSVVYHNPVYDVVVVTLDFQTPAGDFRTFASGSTPAPQNCVDGFSVSNEIGCQQGFYWGPYRRGILTVECLRTAS